MSNNKFIGLILPDVENSFFASIAKHVEIYLQHQNYFVSICSTSNNAEREKSYFKFLGDTGAEGILCISGLNSLTSDFMPDIPTVCIDRRPQTDKPVPWVANDDKEAVCTATEFLIDKGCKHIALIPGYTAEERRTLQEHGYLHAMGKHNLEANENYILRRSGKEHSVIEAEKLVLNLLRQGSPIDGIIASSDRSAFGVLKALRSLGLYVPEDVKLIAFDNSIYAELAAPAITSIVRHPEELAKKSCEILLQMIDNNSVPELENYIPTTLAKRDSTR